MQQSRHPFDWGEDANNGGGCLRPKTLTMTPTQPVQICIHFWFLVHSATGSLPTACQSLKTSQKQCPRPLPMLMA